MLEAKTAQMIVEPGFPGSNVGHIEVIPISAPQPLEVIDAPMMDHGITVDEIEEQPNLMVEIDFDGQLLGVDEIDPEKERLLTVVDDSDEKEEKSEDENDARKSKKGEKWDWEASGGDGFLIWIKERLNSVPKHSGYDTAGLERAISYLERLDNEISKAMRLDLDGDLDANQIEHVRSQIEKGLNSLSDRIDIINNSKKNKKRKKKSSDESAELVKEGQKITGVQGIYVTVPLLISRVARVCINGMISAGHDIEDLYKRQVKKYNLSEREQAETMQLLSDMGYPLRQDRGFMPDEDVDTSSSDNFDWAANYKG